jgi:hypothetical protein
MTDIDPNATQVYAVGIAFAHGELNANDLAVRSRVEVAMRQAIEGAHAEGIGDPDIIRARMLAARDHAKE